MNPAQLPLPLQLDEFRKVLSTNHTLLRVLEGARTLNAPTWYLAGGAISQTIWNHVSSFPPETGIRDYDLVYFDDTDLSYEAEDKVIQEGARLFNDIPVEVEIRNQARVHVWYAKKYGMTCPPHASVEAGIDTWISSTAMIGIRLERDGNWTIYAPRGISDYFNMICRPNTVLGTKEAYDAKVARWKEIWPRLVAEGWPEQAQSKDDKKPV